MVMLSNTNNEGHLLEISLELVVDYFGYFTIDVDDLYVYVHT